MEFCCIATLLMTEIITIGIPGQRIINCQRIIYKSVNFLCPQIIWVGELFCQYSRNLNCWTYSEWSIYSTRLFNLETFQQLEYLHIAIDLLKLIPVSPIRNKGPRESWLEARACTSFFLFFILQVPLGWPLVCCIMGVPV